MKSPDRILLMLAASDLEPGEIHQFFRSIERSGAMRATDLVLELRRHARELRYIGQPKTPIVEAAPEIEGPDADELLRRLSPLHLTNHELHELLLKELRGMGLSARDMPPYNKISLAIWLDRACRRFGIDVLVKAVDNVLARRLPRPAMDWPLKREQ